MRTAYLYHSVLDNLKLGIGILQGKQALAGPHTVMIDIEDNCDLNCIMCYFHSPLIKKREEFSRLSYENYMNVLSNLMSIGTRKISICGKGEPFLHPHIQDILELTKHMNFYVNVITNGIHIDKNFLPKIFSLDQIILSLHAGDKDTYSRVHPQAGEGCFEQLRYILGQIRDYKIRSHRINPWVKIINVIFGLNYDKISEMFQFTEEFKVDEVMFKPAQLTQEQAILKLNPEQKSCLYHSFKKWRNFRIKNNIKEFLTVILGPDSKKGIVANPVIRKPCFIPWYQSVILSNGDVIACAYNQKILGNIKDNNFASIWFSADYNDFRKKLDCGNCAGEIVYPYLMKFKNLLRWKKAN
jgi:MoaA/NifB/PqqE/SkfB family radical SAM enzyme